MHLKLWPLAVAAGLGIVDGLTARDPLQPHDADDEGPGLEFETPTDPRPRAALYELVMNAYDVEAFDRAFEALPPNGTTCLDELARMAHDELIARCEGRDIGSCNFDNLYWWLRELYANAA